MGSSSESHEGREMPIWGCRHTPPVEGKPVQPVTSRFLTFRVVQRMSLQTGYSLWSCTYGEFRRSSSSRLIVTKLGFSGTTR
jgi:hypothetical protein